MDVGDFVNVDAGLYFWMLRLLDFFSFREYIFGVVCCGHTCARGSMLKIGDGYQLRAWRNHYKFYYNSFLFITTYLSS